MFPSGVQPLGVRSQVKQVKAGNWGQEEVFFPSGVHPLSVCSQGKQVKEAGAVGVHLAGQGFLAVVGGSAQHVNGSVVGGPTQHATVVGDQH